MIKTSIISNMEKAILEKATTRRPRIVAEQYKEVCIKCKSPNLQPTGACKVCTDCGETTGCS